VSVNAVASAAVVLAATHILELASRDVLSHVANTESKTQQRNETRENHPDGSREDHPRITGE